MAANNRWCITCYPVFAVPVPIARLSRVRSAEIFFHYGLPPLRWVVLILILVFHA
jgi:hypothetical protein